MHVSFNWFIKNLITIAVFLLVFAVTSQSFGEESPLADNVSRGSQGEQVKELQIRLNSLGFMVGNADGVFGNKTETALREFQHANGLQENGELDDKSYQLLFKGDENGHSPIGAYAFFSDPYRSDTDIHGYGYFIDNCGWEEAKRKAMEMGGYLVNINSMDEYIEIQSEIIEREFSDVAFWIGAIRDYRHGLNSCDYSWIGLEGLPQLDLFDNEIKLEGMNPWAIGEPNYQNSTGEEEKYVRMLFSGGENRWVWEDTNGEIEPWRKTGYIVEFDTEKTVSHISSQDKRVVKQSLPNYPETMPSTLPETPANYDNSLSLLKMEGNSLIARVSAKDKCSLYVEYVNSYDDQTIFSKNYHIDGDMWESLIRLDIPRERFNSLPIDFKIYAVLYVNRPEMDSTEELTQWDAIRVSINKDNNYTSENESTILYNNDNKTYLVVFALASRPEKKDPNILVEIFDTNDDEKIVTTVSLGEEVNLPSGNYKALTPGGESAETFFEIDNQNTTVLLLDQPAADEGQCIPVKVTPELPLSLSYLQEEAVIQILEMPSNTIVATTKAGNTITLFPGNYAAKLPGRAIVETEFVVSDRDCKVILSDEEGPVKDETIAEDIEDSPLIDAYRVIFVCDSNPEQKDGSTSIQLIDEQSGEIVGTTSLGEAVYLQPGIYSAIVSNIEIPDRRFVVKDKPKIIYLQDRENGTVKGCVKDDKTGVSIAGATIELEIGGITYATRTDDNGNYSFANLPVADGRLTLRSGMGNPYEMTNLDVTIKPGKVVNADLSARHKQFIQFVGYLIDGSEEYERNATAFTDRVQSGFYGSIDQDYWFIGTDMYAMVENCVAAQSPDNNSVESEIYDRGTLFNVGSDEHRNKFASHPRREEYLSEIGIQDFGELFLISGYIRPDRLKENNPDYDEWFTGWSENLIEIISVESYYRS